MKKLDIDQAEKLRKKFASDWEIRKGLYLYKKVALDDYNQVLRFLIKIEKPQIKLDHFADFMNFYNELTIGITTHDVNGLTELDFKLALHIDKTLEQMDARQLEESVVTEGYKLQLERDTDMMVLNIVDTKTGKRTEVRGKPGYETDNYDANDKLHRLLDRIGKSADISQLMNGEPVGINPKHSDGASAKTATDKAYSENKLQEAFDNPYPITWEYLKPTGPSSAIAKLDDGSALDIHISEDPAGIYEIEFARGSSKKNMGRSGQGDEFRIFATVQTAMIEWWNQLDKASAKKITFYANKEDGNRSRLYKRFLKIWGDKSEWDIEVNGNVKPGLVAYTLTNPDPDEPQNDKKTWLQRLFGEEQTIENFADGKKKGKSRPGRVKKSGASCNGSVTSLRKKAKKASGEKAKMYHWCANMKSGRK